ncbi:Aste57867_4066 [Aphanomyces stellatus]|uniref:Aste57867_4066 protein n=1 Tax=Aphanomyces stellatus TaxID=120398 RepID=A0A485KDA0_9STRA|nr:hypothetical protein As57867_004055 [Aphanomyces stellatus]VFT81200.1 Aste57867_4066 [Aphanomyces stellatus]
MKLTVKTLQGVAYSIDAELDETVESVKRKVEGVNGAAPENQKLIHAGKVLKDESKLSEYNIKENDFLVVMVTKPKVVRKTATEPAAAPAAAPVAAPVAAPAATAPAAVAPPAQPTPSTSTPAATATTPAVGAAGLVVGEALNDTIRQLCDMGFPEEQVRLALQAAFNNPDRAVEYLMNGIPERPAAPPASAPAGGAAAGGAVFGAPNSLEALRNHPQFDALRRLIQSNPAALPTVLQQIGSQSPELLRLIHQNQEQFVAMLNEPIAESAAPAGGVPASPFGDADAGGMPTPQQLQQLMASLSPQQQAAMAAQMGMTPDQLQQLSQMLSTMPPEAMAQIMQQMQGGGAAAGGLGAPTRIHLTEEEAAAVGRLCDMGFDRNEVIQAYLACDKNEALAANFLMDSMSGDYDDAAGGFGGDSNDDIYG